MCLFFAQLFAFPAQLFVFHNELLPGAEQGIQGAHQGMQSAELEKAKSQALDIKELTQTFLAGLLFVEILKLQYSMMNLNKFDKFKPMLCLWCILTLSLLSQCPLILFFRLALVTFQSFPPPLQKIRSEQPPELLFQVSLSKI